MSLGTVGCKLEVNPITVLFLFLILWVGVLIFLYDLYINCYLFSIWKIIVLGMCQTFFGIDVIVSHLYSTVYRITSSNDKFHI